MLKSKTLNISMALALTFSVLISLACFDAHCDNIRSGVLRLHILANSDTESDQRLKLSVRDEILADCSELFCEVDNYDEAIEQARRNLPQLQASAEKTISEAGFDYSVKVEIGKTDFSTREYEDVTLPAGEYEAVRVLIGNAQGANWWCVCYPNMCIPSASQTEEIGEVLNDKDTKIVTRPSNYVVRFKIVELYEKLKADFKK